MKTSILFVFICLSILLSCQKKKEKLSESIHLSNDWFFKATIDSSWLSATVPGNVHSDLLDHKLIENPFIKDNALKLDWITARNWEYKTTFTLNSKTLQKQHHILKFEGLDTYASIFLNNHLLLKTNNAFRNYTIDVKPFLKEQNTLSILFEKTSTYENKEKEKLPYTLPEGNRIFTRKAQFQYGWDFGTKLNTTGIWRPITLISYDKLRIEDVFIKQEKLTNNEAKLNANITLSNSKKNIQIKVFVNDTLNTVFLPQQENKLITIPLKITNPILWWTHNLGTPYLYTIKVIVESKNEILDTYTLTKGLRTIELINKKDSIGESFYFKLNGKAIYAKGANYIPQNSLQNKVTNLHYENLLNDVVDANMNMLRVWGGGIYENDIFYQLCDKKGILIWQDFMFACAMYPGDTAFLNNVQKEAIDNVKRLRNYASIALWCGNNENAEGWRRWGWKEGRSKKEQKEIWNNYLKVFDSILPKTVANFTDNTNYWETSPKYGRGNPKYNTEGDAHDWWVWHNAYPFEHFEKNVPRFMSEFGFQSLPSYEVIQYINQKDSLDISSEIFKTHQKHHRGFGLIKEYMERDFPIPTTTDDYIYMSQLLQAHGICKGIEAQRRAKPYNMGTLYWQLNDCWPSVSWSSIDFFGNWKALHYQAKKSFKNLLISANINNDNVNIYLVNDTFKSITDSLKIKVLDFKGNILFKDKIIAKAKENSSLQVYQLPFNLFKANKNEVVLQVSFNTVKTAIYLEKPKNLQLLKAPIFKELKKTNDGYEITLTSTVLQKSVFLYTDEHGHFSDNYFDLLPNISKTITFKTKVTSLKNLQLKTVNQFIK